MDRNVDSKPDAIFDSTSDLANQCIEIFMSISVLVIFCVLLHYLCRLLLFDWCNDNQDAQHFQTIVHTPSMNTSNLIFSSASAIIWIFVIQC